jgi:hypothetical protein
MPLKRQNRNSQGIYRRKSNNRWKWMAGATAATAAGVTTSQAITITLVDNYISATGGNHLNADLTGDGHPDVTLTGAKFFFSYLGSTKYGFHFPRWSAAVTINGVYAQGYDNGDYPFRWVILGSQFRFGSGGYVPPPLTGTIPIFFRDPDINGDRLTRGFLEVTVSVDGGVVLETFTYNIPENGSSLALLAMGAGGVLALRRWRAACVRSLP